MKIKQAANNRQHFLQAVFPYVRKHKVHPHNAIYVTASGSYFFAFVEGCIMKIASFPSLEKIVGKADPM